jgi:hypothetical protein
MDCGSFKERVQGRGPILCLTGSVSGSPVAGILGNKLVTLGDPLLPTFIYTISILIWRRDNVVGIVTACGLDGVTGVRVPVR